MQFTIGRPDMVRSINQRWLFKFWEKNVGADRIPRWQAVRPENLTRLSNILSFLDVSGGGAKARFQVRYYGETLAKAYGSNDYRGKFLDEFVPETRHHVALAPYYRTLETGHPVYTIHDLIDCKGRTVEFERLLLPFARNGQDVDRILGSFEFICADGAFEMDSLLVTQTAPAALRLSVVIEPHAVA